jgi:hypothetical protein
MMTTLYALNALGFVCGRVGRVAEGHRFFPLVPGRKVSRKYWPTVTACLPRWARKDGTVVVEVETIHEAVQLGGIWRKSGLDAMRAAGKVVS